MDPMKIQQAAFEEFVRREDIIARGFGYTYCDCLMVLEPMVGEGAYLCVYTLNSPDMDYSCVIADFAHAARRWAVSPQETDRAWEAARCLKLVQEEYGTFASEELNELLHWDAS